MASYTLLDQAEEDALHKYRLLSVEEKPFKRITKRLLSANSDISTLPKLPLTPPPDTSNADEEAAAYEAEKQKQAEERRQFREDVLLDFAAFESSIVRVQFLLTSNAKERERYAAEKLRIEATAQDVRDNTTKLRAQLEEAQKVLALRKTYDDLAEKITSNRLLRPREDQAANLEKLLAEIADLEKESKEYAQTWGERRLQFGRIIEEGMQLRRLIRDEKEEVERREGMEEREDGEDGEAGSPRGRASGAGTPRPDTGGATPVHPSTDGDTSMPGGLTVKQVSGNRGKSPLRAPDPAQDTDTPKPEDVEDINMAEDGEVSVEQDSVASPVEDSRDNEKGEGREEMDKDDQMDTT